MRGIRRDSGRRRHVTALRRVGGEADRTDSGRFPYADTFVGHCPDGIAEGLGGPISRGRADGNPDGFPLLGDPNAEEVRMSGRPDLHDRPAGTVGMRFRFAADRGFGEARLPYGGFATGRPHRTPRRRRRPGPRGHRGGSGRPRTGHSGAFPLVPTAPKTGRRGEAPRGRIRPKRTSRRRLRVTPCGRRKAAPASPPSVRVRPPVPDRACPRFPASGPSMPRSPRAGRRHRTPHRVRLGKR